MPELIIIAGCNGAGKSTFAPALLPDGLTSFDYDRRFMINYSVLPDSELRELFAKNQTTKDFEQSIESSLANQINFCYETNFDSYPLFWPQKFRECGFQINLIFFCVENQDIARHRIQVRKEFMGHFVDNKTIDLKWKAGYKNLNLHYKYFDNILFVDNSKNNDVFTNILQIENDEIVLMTDNIPDYFKHRFPEIYELL